MACLFFALFHLGTAGHKEEALMGNSSSMREDELETVLEDVAL